MSIWKDQRRGLGTALAAWGVFLLLAGSLTGYVVAFSERPTPQETAPKEQAAEPQAAGEDAAVEQAAAEQAEPETSTPSEPASTSEAKSSPSEDAAATEDDEQPMADPGEESTRAAASPSEAAQPTESASDDTTARQTAEREPEAQDVMQPVAATSEVNGHSAQVPSQDQPTEPGTAGLAAPEPAQAEQQEGPSAPVEAETMAEEAPAQEPVQQAFRAPEAPSDAQSANEASPPWQRFSAYFLEEDSRPRVAIVMTGLGMSDGVTEAAIRSLPPEVSLSFSPYARNLASWIGLARVNGHEVLLDLYMEPSTYPLDDPGPQAIMTVLSEEENRKRFDWVLSRGNSFVGLTGRMGSRLLTRRQSLSPVLEDIAQQGLLFVDDRATAGSLGFDLARELEVPAAYSEDMIDEPSANRAAIDAKLNRIERLALTKGAAVALAQPYPVTIERLNVWIAELAERGVVLAPISAVVNRQPPVR